MRLNEVLSPEGAAVSPLYGRAIFVLATRETGAERLLRALASFRSVAASPVPSHIFSRGAEGLTDEWVVANVVDASVGFFGLVDAQELLLAIRLLTDAPLTAVRATTNAERVVEYSPDHISRAGLIASLYPDAHLLHVVRDGRQVAARLASPSHPNRHRVGIGPHGRPARQLRGWRARDAARRWCEDQQAVLAVDHPNVHVVRMEDVLLDPHTALLRLATALRVEVRASELESAIAALGSRHPTPDPGAVRPGAMVELLGPDLLSHYGYDRIDAARTAQLAARLELGMEDSIERGRQEALRLAARISRTQGGQA